jgi:hypothetical protein
MATTKPLRCVEGSFFNRTGRAAKYINSIRVQNLPKTVNAFDTLKEYIIENEDMFGPVLSIRVRRECKKGAKEEKDMVVFIRLHQSEKHVQLLSCLDGEHLQGIQVKATNSNFTNEPHNDDFRFRDDVYWLEYVQYPTWTNNSWSWTNKQYGPGSYCNEDAWRDHSMHKERLRAYEVHQRPPLDPPLDQPPFEQPPIEQPQQMTMTVDLPVATAIDPALQPGTPESPR